MSKLHKLLNRLVTVYIVHDGMSISMKQTLKVSPCGLVFYVQSKDHQMTFREANVKAVRSKTIELKIKLVA